MFFIEYTSTKEIIEAYKIGIRWAKIKCHQKCTELFYRNFISYVLTRNYFYIENNSSMAGKNQISVQLVTLI
jgi:hypothetical protein